MAVEEVVALLLGQVQSSRHSRVVPLQVDLQPVMPPERAALRCWRWVRTMVELVLKGPQGKERCLVKLVQSAPAAMPVPALMTCSCILCSKGARREAEGRRRV